MANAGGSPTITFYVETSPHWYEYETYTADAGMTWEQWVASDYNTAGFYISDYYIYSSDGYRVFNDEYGYDPAAYYESIQDGHYYRVQY